jgi:hypothetical protein
MLLDAIHGIIDQCHLSTMNKRNQKITKLAMIVTVLAMITASMALGETLVMTPVVPGMGEHTVRFTKGQKYTLVVFRKDGQKRYYAGTFIGYIMVLDSKHHWSTDWKPIGKQQEVATVDKNTAKHAGAYLAFKGAHSTLLYENNTDWLIIEGESA